MIKSKPCILKVVQRTGDFIAVPYVLLRGLRDIRLSSKEETDDSNINAFGSAFGKLECDIEVSVPQVKTLTQLTSLNEATRTCDYETFLEVGVSEVLIHPSGEALLADGASIFHYIPESGWRLVGHKAKSSPTFAHLLASLHNETPPEFLAE